MYIERLVNDLYANLALQPGNLDIADLCNQLEIDLDYWEKGSQVLNANSFIEKTTIALNVGSSEKEQLFDFAHELGHYFLHPGNRRKSKKIYIDYVESQANQFAERFLVPFFALDQFELPPFKADAVLFVADYFNVSYHLAHKRLELYYRTQIVEFHDSLQEKML
ncbi:ImmA/IrrE family metallo-endopeptidase [Listeria ilorinensis]|uniref:ImmA/IrrE family metallo-endopeptidase n=1 Tax=Listeria ilorinensis TaxID=2867439 RepID=UPI001EF5F115|nr:ImmA/IrrE family metallo-endopeptidase [Listeria ilorinensis]